MSYLHLNTTPSPGRANDSSLCRAGRCGECPLPRTACTCPCHTTDVERQVTAWNQIKTSGDPLPLLVIECGSRAAVALITGGAR